MACIWRFDMGAGAAKRRRATRARADPLCVSVPLWPISAGSASQRSSGVADSRVLRQEEARQQDVDAEEAVSRERDAFVAGFAQVPFVPQAVELRGEALQDVDAVLVAEVLRPDASQLELQHQFADEPLVRRRAVGAPQR